MRPSLEITASTFVVSWMRPILCTALSLRSLLRHGILPPHQLPRRPFMLTPARTRLALAAMLMAAASAARAQQPAAAREPAPEVGTLAPDFALPGATRYGVLRDPVHLSDFRGKTVVLAFFYKARTKG